MYFILFVTESHNLQERTKGSIQRQYQHCLTNDWLTAKTSPLKKFYVDLKWTKLVKDLENYGVEMSSIYDILNVLDSAKKPRAMNILIEGMTCHLLLIRECLRLFHIGKKQHHKSERRKRTLFT